MCNPASLIVTHDNVYWSEVTESHEDMIAEFHLRDHVGGKTTLMRIECRPEGGRYDSDPDG